MRIYSLLLALLLALSPPVYATVFATVHGVVHDPQHRPIAGAQITLQSSDSAFILHATSGLDGTFELPQAPIGVYQLTVTADGFSTATQPLSIASGTNPVLHIPLSIGTTSQSVVVTASASAADTVTPTSLITRQMIDQTPGASITLGMQMITDYVPGAYMTHDMLHMRGGHQTSWLIDGVAIPNTKIASNVGPQIDPKDIDSLETQRGSYASDVGDRTYGVFNVLPRNGFERNRDAELLLTGGDFDTGEAQLSLGDHTEQTAWYTSLTGSGLPRRHQLPERLRLRHPQPDAEGSVPHRRPVPPGSLRRPLRSQPQRLRVRLNLLLFLGPPRRADRARLLPHRRLGPHHLAQGARLLRALLSRQPVQLRFALH
jgi:hypothetical protein